MWVIELLGIIIFGVSVIAAVCNSIFIQILFEDVDALKKGSEEMIRTRDELLNAIKAVLPEDSTDEVLALLEDVTDTLDSVADSEEWRTKYDDLDKSWRERYKARFFANPAENDAQEEADPEENVDEEPTRFEELFD